MSSKTEIVENALKGMSKEELEKLTTADIKAKAEQLGVSKALIFKIKKRLLEAKEAEAPSLPEGIEPTIRIPEVPKKELIPEEEIEEEEEVIPEGEIEEATTLAPPEALIPEVKVEAKDVEQISDLILGRITGFTKWDGWLLTKEEKADWCPRCADMINKYAPTILIKYFPEVMFTVTTLTIFGGKYAEYRMHKREQEEKAKPPTPPPTPTEKPTTEIATELTPEQIEERKRRSLGEAEELKRRL